MSAIHASAAWEQAAWIVGLMVLACLLAYAAAKASAKAQRRQEIRDQLAGLPKPEPVSIAGLREQLVAAASAQGHARPEVAS